jgi:uncharacterized Zn finger protein
MIELKCWACGWDGHIPDHYVGLRVTCKRCGDVNVAPDFVTNEVNADLWVSEIHAESELDTAESSVRMTSHGAN